MPDAIPTLQQYILDSAVRGRLSPGTEWPKQTQPLRDFANLQNGYAFKSDWFASKGVRLLRNANVGHGVLAWDDLVCLPSERVSEFERFNLDAGDIVLSLDRPFIATGTKVAWVRQRDLPCLLLQRVGRFRFDPKLLLPDYLYMWLRSSLFNDQIDPGRSNGVPHISSKQVEEALIQIPGVDEQRRLVKTVEKLTAACDQLGSAQEKRERRRDRLAAASLHRLNQPTAAASMFREHARFHLRHLPYLTARSEQITQLRQTILNIAVQGRLLSQNLDDQPAPYFGIKDCEQRDDRLDLSLPTGWSWARVENVAEARLGKMLDKAKNAGQHVRYLRNTNVHWFEIRMDGWKEMQVEPGEVEKFALRSGDVLICEGGHGIGRTAIWEGDEPDIIFQKALHRVRPGSALNGKFFAFCMSVYFHSGILQRYFTGVGIPHFTGVALSKLVFPLPPLSEQKRIVAKVDELFSICNRLEAQLTTAQNEGRCLLEAVLHQALHTAN
ncbi:restriction endonuclease subunit S [Tundrisphaera lichenicola]|uniref:restriction endonuclease subunit S n=1 Tax=Tundrisphaera lichenicola TaxID=2029860 RepID=UPI003EBCAD2A